MGSADLHLHTALGDGLPDLRALLAHVESHTDLDVIAITEHDQIDAALRLRELHARGRFRFDVAPGAEITTLEGHLLALFIERPVPSLRSLPRTLDAIHRQGGLAVIPHPMSPYTRSIGRHGIERILRRRADGLWFDGIELGNASPAGRPARNRARALNDAVFHLPVLGSSDAHYLPAVGCGRTHFAGRTAAELRAAIEAGQTTYTVGRHPSVRELGYGNIVRQTARALTATPKRVVGEPLWRLVAGRAGAAP